MSGTLVRRVGKRLSGRLEEEGDTGKATKDLQARAAERGESIDEVFSPCWPMCCLNNGQTARGMRRRVRETRASLEASDSKRRRAAVCLRNCSYLKTGECCTESDLQPGSAWHLTPSGSCYGQRPAGGTMRSGIRSAVSVSACRPAYPTPSPNRSRSAVQRTTLRFLAPPSASDGMGAVYSRPGSTGVRDVFPSS